MDNEENSESDEDMSISKEDLSESNPAIHAAVSALAKQPFDCLEQTYGMGKLELNS